MFNAVRFSPKIAIQKFQAYALLQIALSSAALTGCSALVTANNAGGGSPTPLTISGVQAGTPTASGFQVNWSTNLAANSAVDYGTTANYGSSTPTNSVMVTSHQVAVTGLTPGTLYHFRARSTDASNSSISSADLTFSTAASSGPVISGVSVGSITTSAATVTWTTDVGATSQVEYGTTTAYGNLTALNSSLVTSHTTPLASLGANTLYHYRVHSKNSGGVESISGDFAFQTSSVVDTTPPTISITAPANGATVSGTVTVSANATDNVGVTSVQFFLDGANLGLQLVAAPYSITWNSTSTINGAHTLTAQARDAAGNVGNATPVSVTVSNSGNSALQDFQSRCATSGVIVCEGFDNASEFVPASWPNTGLYPGSDNTIEIVQDTSVYASGGGSLHFPIKANDGTGSTVRDDNWIQLFCGAHPPASCSGTLFGPNTTFYVQFRYRVDTSYATTNWELSQNGGSSPKIADFANHSLSCAATEITTNNRNGLDYPMMYTNCGAAGMFVDVGTTSFNAQVPPYEWQNGYYYCEYSYTPLPPGGCFSMPANTWMTFYYRIQLGGNGTPNSHITAWVSQDGQPLQKFIEVTNMPLSFDTPGYDAIFFNVYMTGFSSTATNPAANAWLDEVIVSSAPVPAPAANGGGIPQ
jgi:Bacterial Ig domain